MNIIEAIHERHSIDRLEQQPVPREIIAQLLDAAVQAPNHFKVYPWRFVVIQGEGRAKLGDALAAAMQRKAPNVPPEGLEKERQKAFRSPLLIAVIATKAEDPRALEVEAICAAAAATENILLAATQLGLGAKWRTTGTGAYEPEVRELFGCGEGEHIVSILYIGYPSAEVPMPNRPGWEDQTTWME